MKITTKTDPLTFAITQDVDTAAVAGIDQDNKIISATGDISGFLEKGSRINITGSTGNDRTYIRVGYTVVSAIYDGTTNTDIIIREAIPDATVDGDVEYYLGIDKVTQKFIIDGDQTSKFATNDIIEIIDAENPLLNGAYKVVSDTLAGGKTEIIVLEDIPTVLGVFSGKVLTFEGSLAGFFMAKGLGSSSYNIFPQGSVLLGKRKAVVLMGRQNDQRQGSSPHEDSISVSIPSETEFVFKFSELRDPIAANIDAAILAIKAVVNP